MFNIICWIKGHKRGKTSLKKGWWYIQCSRCGYKIDYASPFIRLIAVEILEGFDGD